MVKRSGWFGALLRLNPLPHLFDGQPVTQRAVVIPLVTFNFTFKRLRLPFDVREDFAEAVLGSLFVLLPLQCIGSADRRADLAIFVNGDKYEMDRCDVLELRVILGENIGLLA